MWPDEATSKETGEDLARGSPRKPGRQIISRGRSQARTTSSGDASPYEEHVHDLDYYNEYDDAPEMDREVDEEEDEEEEMEPRLEGQPRRPSKYAVVWVRDPSLTGPNLLAEPVGETCRVVAPVKQPQVATSLHCHGHPVGTGPACPLKKMLKLLVHKCTLHLCIYSSVSCHEDIDISAKVFLGMRPAGTKGRGC